MPAHLGEVAGHHNRVCHERSVGSSDELGFDPNVASLHSAVDGRPVEADCAWMEEAANALIVVDAQIGVLSGDGAVPDAEVVLERLGMLIDAAHRAGALVVLLQNDGPPGSFDEPHTSGWPIHPQLRRPRSEVVIRKCTDDGFDGTALGDVLDAKAVRHVAIAGLLSEMCVSATVRGVVRHRLLVSLATDAHATYNLDDIASTTVSRVAEHSLGDLIRLPKVSDIHFAQSSNASGQRP